MNNDPNPTQPTETTTPLRCVLGAAVAGGLGYAAYSLMIAIATNFAKKPIHSDNQLVVNLTSAVRTLVVGIVALGSGIFSLVAIGLLALGIQLLIQQWTKSQNN
ncbi:DUF3082 domain-containing protein [Nostoc sp. TCL26-01]|uniref:DUF3082 domain-containing protein n=1 Tax=Nostoc sp. TCL26-01 TaxID=2576904 RepID=UPI0015BEFE39|nr:DUF3082 domain-containing protein [Nostoc sp. TCL26-01]QLE58399.1 DUF3082 domain-containing protein [Nostoc sp. TCL26-01]